MASSQPIADHVAASFARQGLMQSLGARLLLAHRGRCTIEAAFDDALGQQHRFFHGGALAALADTAAGYAALSLLPAGADVLTAEFKISFLRPARGRLAQAEAHVLGSGKRLATVSCRVAVSDGADRLHCAELLATISLRQGS